ncbi:hypothetical protein AB0I00_21960 [Streptomyces sp. NPDC050803]|uniref:hypothetical protein n=1 Tax=unclassified Streptomyces TaxID=2593676 RepID=UPI003430ECC5
MHRTTTTAALLVTVAVSALSGCVTVQRPPVTAPPAPPSQPPAPGANGRSEPQIVQAPAQEALELIGPPRHPDRKKLASEQPAAPSADTPTPAHRPSAPHPQPRRPHPKQQTPDVIPAQPRVEIPDVSESVRKNTDVCGLGKKYGGWHRDSPEAAICEQAYGR